MKKFFILKLFIFIIFLFLAGCSSTKPKPFQSTLATSPLQLKPLSFKALPLWERQNDKSLMQAFKSFKKSCHAAKIAPLFKAVCREADTTKLSPKAFFMHFFRPYLWLHEGEERETFFTGYYEASLKGKLKPDANYTVPLRGVPDDLIKIELASLYPELKGKVVRGRFENGSIVPYYTREEIEKRPPRKVLCWLKDKVSLFFLQIQGSGRIELDNNQTLFVGYGDKNGHAYQSIGNYMLKNRIMPYSQMSLEGIKAWAQAHPDKIDKLLNINRSYLFFRLRNTSAVGAQGVVLTPRHSCAVDTRYLPLGLPLFVSFSHPLTQKPYAATVIAQDRGAAIKGGHRIDYFWGWGEEAERLAGHTKTRGEAILLLPQSP